MTRRSRHRPIGLIGSDEATVGRRFLYAQRRPDGPDLRVSDDLEGELMRLQDIVDPNLPPFGAIGIAAMQGRRRGPPLVRAPGQLSRSYAALVAATYRPLCRMSGANSVRLHSHGHGAIPSAL